MPPVFVSEDDFLLQNYTYELPQEQIAQYPPEQRGTSRLLTMRRNGALDLEHHMFSDLPDCLPEGALLVANNSRVLQARLLGSRSTGGKVEFLLLTPLPLVRAAATPVKGREDTWSAEVNGLVRSGGSVREGETLHFGAGISVTILECGTFGHRRVRMCWKGDVADAFAATGHIPLPPYIKEELQDQERYQTVYSKVNGSAAAPTAGLHFTQELLERVTAMGVKIGYVTLHVGLGTFRPVKEDEIEGHEMHSEYCIIPQETADLINETRKNGGRVICVGTTSCRTIESWAAEDGTMTASAGWTDIFIYPGYRFKVMDALITNFHLPESTLIMLVSALAGREHILAAYREAVREKYRFFSFGDAMFIQ